MLDVIANDSLITPKMVKLAVIPNGSFIKLPKWSSWLSFQMVHVLMMGDLQPGDAICYIILHVFVHCDVLVPGVMCTPPGNIMAAKSL